jgi:hypothetical protein
MILKMALLADVHVGAISSNQLYEELKTEFLDFIKKRYLDIIFIAGDFYNSVISLNSQSSIMAFNFIFSILISSAYPIINVLSLKYYCINYTKTKQTSIILPTKKEPLIGSFLLFKHISICFI